MKSLFGDFDLYYVNDQKSGYCLGYVQLQEDRDKGERVTGKDMIERETESNLNPTWFVKDFNSRDTIKKLFYDKDSDKLK